MEVLKTGKKCIGPSEELRVAVTFRRPDGLPGPTKFAGPLTVKNIKEFVPKKQVMEDGIQKLSDRGFTLTGRGLLTVSMKCSPEIFEKEFGISLGKKRLPMEENLGCYSIYYPTHRPGALWKPILKRFIDDVYIQWPHLYPARIPFRKSDDSNIDWNEIMKGATRPSATPPKLKSYHLEVPRDVAFRLNATPLHKMGMKGEGIRVVMIDSGFDHSHPFFSHHQYKSEVVLAGDAKDKETDAFGHGTGESANVFSVAPRVEFIGVKIGKDTFNSVFEKVPPASLLEGFYVARQQNPDIISISVTHNLQYEMSKKQRAHLPKSVKALEAEILHAIASGITVVVAAGNGEFSFPGMMPDVISAGGVHVDKNGHMRASNYASAFYSKIYSYRHVPDICGLVGMCEPQGKDLKLKQGPGLNLDNYILLPVPAGSLIDAKTIASLTVEKSNKYRDGTRSSDGWALFSGTSAAAPQIAGVCALLKAKKPSLKPWEIKAILQATAIEVLDGHSNPDSSDDGTPQVGAGATGGGLVDAFSAWRSVT